MMRTQAVVFDMDEVFIDSEESHAHAKLIALVRAGIALSIGVAHADCSPVLR